MPVENPVSTLASAHVYDYFAPQIVSSADGTISFVAPWLSEFIGFNSLRSSFTNYVAKRDAKIPVAVNEEVLRSTDSSFVLLVRRTIADSGDHGWRLVAMADCDHSALLFKFSSLGRPNLVVTEDNTIVYCNADLLQLLQITPSDISRQRITEIGLNIHNGVLIQTNCGRESRWTVFSSPVGDETENLQLLLVDATSAMTSENDASSILDRDEIGSDAQLPAIRHQDLGLLLASLDDIVSEYDADGNFLRLWCREPELLTSLPEGYLRKSMQEAFQLAPMFTARFILDFERALRNKEICYREFEWTVNEQTRWFGSKITPLFTAKDEPQGFIQRITDISERKKVELAIAEKQTQLYKVNSEFEEIIQYATEIIFKLDPAGKFIFGSTEFQRTLGYNPQDLIGRHFTSIVHSDDVDDTLAEFSKVVEFGKADKNIVFRVRHDKGHYLWFTVSAVCIYHFDGTPKHCIGFAQNVTELQELVDNLRETQERYAAFIQNSSEAIWRFEPAEPIPTDTAEDEIIHAFFQKAWLAECNDQMARLYGYESGEELVGKFVNEFLSPDDFRNIEFFRAFIRSGFRLANAESHETDRFGNKKIFVNNLVGIIKDDHLVRVWGMQRDITEQRDAESKIRYQAHILQNLSDAIISTDVDFKILSWNRAAETIYGKSYEEVAGKSIRSVVVHHYLGITREEIVRQLETQDSWTGEVYFDREDGKRKFLLMTLTNVRNERGERTGYAGIHKDITEQYEAANALRVSEERYRSLFEALGEGIVLIDASGKVLACNKSAERIFGSTRSEILDYDPNVYPVEYIHEDGSPFPPSTHPAFETLKTGKSFKDVVMGLVRAGKETLWISLNTEPVYYSGNNNKPDAVVTTSVDITMTKAAKAELLKSRNQLREYSDQITNILNSITDGFIAVDNQFNIRLWNHVFEKVTGKTRKEVIGKHISDVFPSLPGTSVFPLYLDALEKKKTIVLEHYYDRFGIWFETSAYPSDDGLFIYFRDITHRKKQDKLQALEKEVLEKNAQASVSLQRLLDDLLLGIESIFPDTICSILTLRPDALHMEHLSAPSLPPSFCEVVNGVPIGPNSGSCGTAMYLKEIVISSDINIDPRWNSCKSFALQYGLASCWSFPIINSKNAVLATIAAYHRYVKSPSEEDIAVFSRISNLLRIIIENKRAEATIRLSNERYLLATKATNDALWDWDVVHGLIYWGDGFFQIFGYMVEDAKPTLEFWESCIHPDDRSRVMQRLNNFVESNGPGIWSDEYRFRNAKGKYLLVHDRGFLIFNKEGKVTRMVGSLQDVTEKRQLEKKLLKQQLNKQKTIAQAIVDAQEKERADIGKELHDNVNQILSTTRLYLELARTNSKERLGLIDKSTKNIVNAINEIRFISHSLVPASINDLGVVPAIQDLVENIRFTRKLAVEFYHEGDIDKLVPDKLKLVLFRIIQEQVTNVLKHSEAKNLIIELMLDEKAVQLSITDDGIGFDAKSKNKKGVGLYNIESRAELFNGKMSIVASPGKGCKLNIRVPL
jgi:PAS domain S-box-containing protein